MDPTGTPAPVATSFSVEALIDAIKLFAETVIDLAKDVLEVITDNQILWIFLAFSICTIGISVLRRIRRIF